MHQTTMESDLRVASLSQWALFKVLGMDKHSETFRRFRVLSQYTS
jgi:hypothetical protein